MKFTTHVRIALVAAVLAVAAIAVVLLRGRGGDGALAASGTVEATEARLGFDVPGRVAAVLVHEGDRVPAGAVVAVLDSTEAAARAGQARAQVDGARAQLEELERGSRSEEISRARAENAAAQEKLEEARRDRARAQILFDGGALSQEGLDRARTSLEVAQAQAQAAADQAKLVEVGPRRERIEAQRAALAQARAALDGALATLEKMTARAPFAGVVTVRHREPGETVAAGNPAITLMNPDDRWVRIFVPENRIGRVHLGDAASIVSDSHPGKTYRGEVVFIASEAEFTPKNVQTQEERVKLVYAVKVKVTEDPTLELKPGMPADVTLEPGKGA